MLPPWKHSRTAELLCSALPESREQISASVRINGEQIAATIQPSLSPGVLIRESCSGDFRQCRDGYRHYRPPAVPKSACLYSGACTCKR